MLRFGFLLLALGIVQAWVVPPVPSCRRLVAAHQKSSLKSSEDDDSSSKPLSYEEASALADGTAKPSREEEEIIAATLEGYQTGDTQAQAFDDASQRILKQENDEMASTMEPDEDDDEFYEKSEQYDAIREAIRARTADLGIEKSVLQAQLIEDAEKRAAAGERVTGLDLSKIDTFQRGLKMDDEDEDDNIPKMPMMMDDLEDEWKQLSDEQRKRINPTEGMKWYEELMYEANQIEWPKPKEIFKEMGLLIATVIFMAVFIINLDNFLREKSIEYGMIPRPEDITQSFEGLQLPEGWTEGLNEQDIVDVP